MTDTPKPQQPEDEPQRADKQADSQPANGDNDTDNQPSTSPEPNQPSSIDEAGNELPPSLPPIQDGVEAASAAIDTAENHSDDAVAPALPVQDSFDAVSETVAPHASNESPASSAQPQAEPAAVGDDASPAAQQNGHSVSDTKADCATGNIHQGGTLRLPNARQNQPYHAPLDDEAACRELKNLRLIDDSGTTLTLDGHSLCGVPAVNGECALRLHGTREDGNTVALTLALLINPDPKTLWHNIEPQSPLFRKAHQDWQHAADTRVSMTAARVRGRSHAHKGSFCEDDIAILVDGEGVGYIGMVADGAGSSRFSRLASQVLCNSLPRHLGTEIRNLQNSGEFDKLYALFDGNDNQQQQALSHIGNILANAVKRALHDLLEHTRLAVSEGKNQPPQPITIKDLYTTCLAFWALPLADNRWALASYWVGDGGLAVEHDNQFTLLGVPDGGEFSGQTRFLAAEETTDAALAKRLRTGIYHNLQSVWAMTDGITDAKFASEQQLENSEQWQDLTDDIVPALDSADSLYEWLGFWSQGNHDDRSLCVLRVLASNEPEQGGADE